MQKCRPCLTTCLIEALRKARSRTGSFRNVLRMVAYITMFLADKEDLLSWKPDLPNFYSKYSIHRFLLVRNLKEIMTAAMEIEERLLDEDDGGTRRRRQIALSAMSNCTVAVNRITYEIITVSLVAQSSVSGKGLLYMQIALSYATSNALKWHN